MGMLIAIMQETELDATVWQDELMDGKLSYRAILTYFERVRTMALGVSEDGELALERLQKEGVAVVVSKMASHSVLRTRMQAIGSPVSLSQAKADLVRLVRLPATGN